ncbi:hypothetical protein P3H15_55060, partial [Rhodococcus sp. T2V]|nr:hypothetical protein [Rhodococcus sp. T2V]
MSDEGRVGVKAPVPASGASRDSVPGPRGLDRGARELLSAVTGKGNGNGDGNGNGNGNGDGDGKGKGDGKSLFSGLTDKVKETASDVKD